MRKPSIFSRNYEQLMKKRRRKIIAINSFILILIIITCSITVKELFYKKVSYNEILNIITRKSNAKEGKVNKNYIAKEEEIKEEESQVSLQEKVYNTIIKKNINNVEIVLEVNSNDGKIENVSTNLDNIYFSLNKTANLVVVLDEEQNLFVIDNKGDIKDLTLQRYISPDKEVFEKKNVLENYEEYLWHSEARFLSDNKVIYISNIPYFGYNLSKYLSIVNIETLEHKTIWSLKGKNIIINEINNLGLEVNIDGNIKNISVDSIIN